jgi:3-phosphoshikimate 1-carboxyvinyltransferase
MGGKIKIKKLKKTSGEIVGSIQVEYSKLKGINIPAKLSPYLIDEYPILSIAAAVAKGKTKMQGLTELKYKESNRIKSINENLRKCGIDSQVNKDNITINGSRKILSSNKKIKTYGDHRIAMSFSILSLITKNPLQIDNEECIKISYPNFKKDLNKLIHK